MQSSKKFFKIRAMGSHNREVIGVKVDMLGVVHGNKGSGLSVG
jgi:hypothetical protein